MLQTNELELLCQLDDGAHRRRGNADRPEVDVGRGHAAGDTRRARVDDDARDDATRYGEWPAMATGAVSVPLNPLPIRLMNLWFPPPPPTKMKSGFDNVLAVRNSVTGLVATSDAPPLRANAAITVGCSERQCRCTESEPDSVLPAVAVPAAYTFPLPVVQKASSNEGELGAKSCYLSPEAPRKWRPRWSQT